MADRVMQLPYGSRYNRMSVMDEPAQTQFVNTYAPMPFDQILRAGQMKQQRYDKGMAAMQQLEAGVEGLKYIGSGADKEYIAEVNEIVDDIVGQYSQKDLSDSFVLNEMMGKVDSKVDKGRISDIQESYEGAKAAQKIRNELKATGRYNPELDEDPMDTWDSQAGVYDYSPSAYIPKEKTLKPMFERLITPTLLGTIGDVTSPNVGMNLIGRTMEHVAEVSAANADEYASTPSGQDEIKLFKMKHPELAEELGDDVAIAESIMNDYGTQYVNQRLSGSRLSAAHLKARFGDDKGPGGPGTIISTRGSEERSYFDNIERDKEKLQTATGDEKVMLEKRLSYNQDQLDRIRDPLNEAFEEEVSKYKDDKKIEILKKTGMSSEQYDKFFSLLKKYPNIFKVLNIGSVPTRTSEEIVDFFRNAGFVLWDFITKPAKFQLFYEENSDLFKEGIIYGNEEAKKEVKTKWGKFKKEFGKDREEVEFEQTGMEKNEVNRLLIVDVLRDISKMRNKHEKEVKGVSEEEGSYTYSPLVANTALSIDKTGQPFVTDDEARASGVAWIKDAVETIFQSPEGYDIKTDIKDKNFNDYILAEDQPAQISLHPNMDGTVKVSFKMKEKGKTKSGEYIGEYENVDVNLNPSNSNIVKKLQESQFAIEDYKTASILSNLYLAPELHRIMYNEENTPIESLNRYSRDSDPYFIRYDKEEGAFVFTDESIGEEIPITGRNGQSLPPEQVIDWLYNKNEQLFINSPQR